MQFTYEREFTYTRNYHGPIRCVILDWAGTTMDFWLHGASRCFPAGIRKGRCSHQSRRSTNSDGSAQDEFILD